MCGWIRLKFCWDVVAIQGKALQLLQGHSKPSRHSHQPSQPASHLRHFAPRGRVTRQSPALSQFLGEAEAGVGTVEGCLITDLRLQTVLGERLQHWGLNTRHVGL